MPKASKPANEFLATLWEVVVRACSEKGVFTRSDFVEEGLKVCRTFSVSASKNPKFGVAPKRTLYNIFCKHMREKEFKNLGFNEASVVLAKKWKEVNEKDPEGTGKLKSFIELHEQEKQRYDEEVKDYQENNPDDVEIIRLFKQTKKIGTDSKIHATVEEKKSAGSVNSYHVFTRERNSVEKLSSTQLKSEWDSLSKEEKEVYTKKAKEINAAEKPKKPKKKSGYTLFFQEVLAELTPEERKQYSKIISQRWKELKVDDPEAVREYNDRARAINAENQAAFCGDKVVEEVVDITRDTKDDEDADENVNEDETNEVQEAQNEEVQCTEATTKTKKKGRTARPRLTEVKDGSVPPRCKRTTKSAKKNSL